MHASLHPLAPGLQRSVGSPSHVRSARRGIVLPTLGELPSPRPHAGR